VRGAGFRTRRGEECRILVEVVTEGKAELRAMAKMVVLSVWGGR
jgi:hypothetical protein